MSKKKQRTLKIFGQTTNKKKRKRAVDNEAVDNGEPPAKRVRKGEKIQDSPKYAGLNQATNDRVSSLFVAAMCGHTETIKILLAAGAEVNQADSYRRTPLYIATHNGRTAAIIMLLAAGATVNQAADGGGTPLHLAAQCGHTEAIKMLLAAGANVNQADNVGITPLYLAAMRGHTETIKILLAAGAEVNQAANNRFIPLFVAAHMGKLEAIQTLVEGGADFDQRSWDMMSDDTKQKAIEFIELLLSNENILLPGGRINSFIEVVCRNNPNIQYDFTNILSEYKKVTDQYKAAECLIYKAYNLLTPACEFPSEIVQRIAMQMQEDSEKKVIRDPYIPGNMFDFVKAGRKGLNEAIRCKGKTRNIEADFEEKPSSFKAVMDEIMPILYLQLKKRNIVFSGSSNSQSCLSESIAKAFLDYNIICIDDDNQLVPTTSNITQALVSAIISTYSELQNRESKTDKLPIAGSAVMTEKEREERRRDKRRRDKGKEEAIC